MTSRGPGVADIYGRLDVIYCHVDVYSGHHSSDVDLSDPATAVMSRGTSAVLRVLSGADRAFTGRETARLAGVSHSRAQQALALLVRHGLVWIEEHDAANLYRFNRDHLAAGAIEDLVRLRARFIEALRDMVATWTVAPVQVSLFGSAARGDGDTNSDVDMLAVRPNRTDATDSAWTAQLSGMVDEVRRLTGNSLTWIDLSTEELGQLIEARDPMVEEWRDDGLTIAGPDLSRLLLAPA